MFLNHYFVELNFHYVGDTWFEHKRLITSTFNSYSLDEYITVVNKKVEILSECIQEKVRVNLKNQPVNIFDLAVKYSLDAMCENATGIDMDLQREPDNAYFNAFRK